MAVFWPDRYLRRITDIDVVRDCLEAGFTHLLLDIDNTILPRDTHQVPQDIRDWLAEAERQGLQICLLSNNFHHGVYEWAQRLGLPVVAKAVKPLPHGFLMARRKIRSPRAKTLVVGDQLITDVWGAHFAGMKVFMLCPLVETDLVHTRILRHVEALFMRRREPEERAPLASRAETGAQAQHG